MLTRAKYRQESCDAKKYVLMAFPTPPTSGIFKIETVDGAKEKLPLPGSTLKVMVNEELKKGTIVFSSENPDDLLRAREKIDVAALLGIKVKRKNSKRRKRQSPPTNKKQKTEDRNLNITVTKKRSRIPVPITYRRFDITVMEKDIPTTEAPTTATTTYDKSNTTTTISDTPTTATTTSDIPTTPTTISDTPTTATTTSDKSSKATTTPDKSSKATTTPDKPTSYIPIAEAPTFDDYPEYIDVESCSPAPVEVNISGDDSLDIVQSPNSYTSFVSDRAVASHKNDFGISPILRSDVVSQSLDHSRDLNRAFNVSWNNTSNFSFKLENDINIEQRLEDIRPTSISDFSEYVVLESPNQDVSHSYADEGVLEVLQLSPLVAPRNRTATESSFNLSTVDSSKYITPDKPIPFVPPMAPVKNSPRVHNYLPIPYSPLLPNEEAYPQRSLFDNQETVHRSFPRHHQVPVHRDDILPELSSQETDFSNRYFGFYNYSNYNFNPHQNLPSTHSFNPRPIDHPTHHDIMPFPRPTVSGDCIFRPIQSQRLIYPSPAIQLESATHPVHQARSVPSTSVDVIREQRTSTKATNYDSDDDENNGNIGVGSNQCFSHPKLLQLCPIHIRPKKLTREYLLQCIDGLSNDVGQNQPNYPSHELILDAWNSSKNLPEVFARELLARMFTLEELRGRNVYGITRRKKPTGALDQTKVAYIKSLVEYYFPSSHFAWKMCVVKMNESIGNTFKKLAKCKWLNIDSSLNDR